MGLDSYLYTTTRAIRQRTCRTGATVVLRYSWR